MKSSSKLAIIVALIGFVLFFISPLLRSTNNVCKTFRDYYSNRDTNENCYYNPDYKLEVPDIIKRHGYPVETHLATTKDGYILTLFRIPHGREPKSKPGKPVLILHGLATNSGTFVNIGRKSLGFVLADAGYDVWLGNFRGSKYSQNHTHLDNKESKFWDFSFHEYGIYDVPAQVDLINQITKKRIIYIGFSIATATGYIYSSMFPGKASEKIEVAVSLAPTAILKNLVDFNLVSNIWPYLKGPIQALTSGKAVPRPFMPNFIYKYFCFPLPIQMEICQLIDMFLLGVNYKQNDPETLPITMKYNLDATSIKTVSHILQMVQSGNFEQYSYGTEENKRVYGSPEPLNYKLSKIKVPHYLISAPNDKEATKADIKLLHKVLSKEAGKHGIYTIKDENFNHVDIITGKDAKTLVYEPIVNFLNSL